MKPRRQVSHAGIILALLVLCQSAVAAIPAIGDQPVPSLAPIIKGSAPAVVNIAVRGRVATGRNRLFEDPFFREFFGNRPRRQREFESAGSGVIVDADNGYVLTNHHVIENADEITVTLKDNRSFSAEVVGSDEGSDVAVLKVAEDDLIDIPLADSDALEVGDFVLAIGNPFGLQHTVTSGIVSALGRSGINRDNDSYEDFIQTDASINPGNSGGALINLRGELVGINSAILTRSGGNIGIGFAIPINMVRNIMRQIIEFGVVRRGLLGVTILSVTSEMANEYELSEARGALVSGINPDSAAERAGVEVNDVILSVNGEEVDDAGALKNSIGLLRVGEEVTLQVIRAGKAKTLTARLGERDGETEQPLRASEEAELRGMEGAELASYNASASGSSGTDGVAVISVEPGSPAARRGLRADDIITHVNTRRVRSLRELRDAASELRSLRVQIVRDGRRQILPIR